MRWLPRVAILLLTAWVTADAAMPFVPGAFQFDPDECVEIVITPNQSMVVLPDPRDTTPPDALFVPVRADATVRRDVPRGARLERQDRPRRRDHDRGSSLRASDPA